MLDPPALDGLPGWGHPSTADAVHSFWFPLLARAIGGHTVVKFTASHTHCRKSPFQQIMFRVKILFFLKGVKKKIVQWDEIIPLVLSAKWADLPYCALF